MPIEKQPRAPVPRGTVLANSRPYRVRDGDSWATVAAQHGVDPAALIWANFQTLDPAEVNWYLRHYVGCKKMTRDRTNWMFGSEAVPGIIYIPLGATPMPPGAAGGNRWRKMSFWIELYAGNLWAYTRVRGALGMRLDHHPSDWYAWSISASLLCANVPTKGAPPVGVGTINSEEQTFEYHPALLNPVEEWKRKSVFVRLAANYAWVRIQDALPKTPSQHYRPIKGVTTRDLVIKVQVDSVQLGWCAGIGGMEDGRKVRPRRASPGVV